MVTLMVTAIVLATFMEMDMDTDIALQGPPTGSTPYSTQTQRVERWAKGEILVMLLITSFMARTIVRTAPVTLVRMVEIKGVIQAEVPVERGEDLEDILRIIESVQVLEGERRRIFKGPRI